MRHCLAHCFLLLPLAACGSRPDPEPPSDPTDYFYRNESVAGSQTYPPIRWHERAPGRYFETTLRPTKMRAALPTAYLSRITRNYHPWARRIYDVAELSFNFANLKPLPPQRVDGSYPGPHRDEVLVELGRWEASRLFTPEEEAGYQNGRIERRGDNVIIRGRLGGDIYFFDKPETGEVDGNPVAVECIEPIGCRADLVFPQELTNLGQLPTENGVRPYKGTVGSRIRIQFNAARISDWIEVRRKALCFVSLSIKDANFSGEPALRRMRCGDVRKAINRTINQ